MKNIESLVDEALKEINNVSIDANQVRKILTDLATKASQNGLQPLPEEMPEWLSDRLEDGYPAETIWNRFRQHFGTKPREWWMKLEKGDKFVDKNGEIREYSGIVFLDTDNGGGIICPVHLCSPYTPTTLEQFMQSLTPEQLELAKSLKIEEIVKQNKT